MPCLKAKNSSRNWPAKSVRPIVASIDQEIAGRGRKNTNGQAMRNLRAVSCGAEKLSKPNLVKTNAKPQMIEARQARMMWDGRMAFR